MRRGLFDPSLSSRPMGASSLQIGFDQPWFSYKEGFGDIEGEFWLGNENVHLMTSHPPAPTQFELQIDLLSAEGESISIVYDEFRLSDENDFYRIHVSLLIYVLLNTPTHSPF